MSNDQSPPNFSFSPTKQTASPGEAANTSSPVVATVFGITHLAYALYCLTMILISIISSELLPRLVRNQPDSELTSNIIEVQKRVSHTLQFKISQYLNIIGPTILVILLIIAGVLLLKHSRLGRTLSFIWAAGLVGFTLVSISYNLFFVLRVTREIYAELLPFNTSSLTISSLIGSASQIMLCNFCFIYPLLVTIFMLPRKVKNSLS